MFKTRGKMNGQTPSKRGALPLLLHSQFNTSLWFMKTRNDAPSVVKESVRKTGARSESRSIVQRGAESHGRRHIARVSSQPDSVKYFRPLCDRPVDKTRSQAEA